MHEHGIRDFQAKFGVIICSSTRTEKTDSAGSEIRKLLTDHGHTVSGYEIVKDDVNAIRAALGELLSKSDSVVISGGTGITSHDVTIDAVRSMAEYEMTGFSHVFASLSMEEIGTSAVLSRATAFVVNRKPVFCLPGSPSGASMGVRRIILKEIDHIHHELNR